MPSERPVVKIDVTKPVPNPGSIPAAPKHDPKGTPKPAIKK
jgi:hypothetical protein